METGEREEALAAMRSGHQVEINALEFIEAIIQLSEESSEVNYFKKLAFMATSSPVLSGLMPEFEAKVRGLRKEPIHEILFKLREKLDRGDYKAVLDIVCSDKCFHKEPAVQRILAAASLKTGAFDLAVDASLRVLEVEPESHYDRIRLGDAFAAEAKQEAIQAYTSVAESGQPQLQMEAAARLVEYYDLTGDRERALTWSDITNQHLKAISNSAGQHNPSNLGNTKTVQEKLRVGHFINERALLEHADILEALVRFYDRERYELIIYQQYDIRHPLTSVLRVQVDCWLESHQINDATLSHIIANDEVHLIVDWCGLFSGHRQAVLATKPARLNLGFLGLMPERLGSVMDGQISFEAGGAKCFHMDVPGTYGLSSQSSTQAHRISSSLKDKGRITFGSGCDLARLIASAEGWSRVLNAVPDSIIVLGDIENVSDNIRDKVREVFAKFGLAERCFIIDAGLRELSRAHMLAHTDILLDYACHGDSHLILEALQSRIPVISYECECGGTRRTNSILTTMGLEGWLAMNEDEFVEIALNLSSPGPNLSDARQRLTGIVNHSRLADPKNCIKSMERAIQDAWQSVS